MSTMTLNELVEKIVREDVLYCASMMMYELREVADQLDDYDTYLDLQVGRPDYKEAGEDYLRTADLSELEEVADSAACDVGWDSFLDEIGYNVYVATCEESDIDPDDFDDWINGQDACHTKEESFTKALREAVITEVNDWQEVCDMFRIDAYAPDVYEHWIISNWLARQLEDMGEVVGEYLGLTIWGRTTSGQSITMDYVIQQIAKKTQEA